MEKYDKDTEEKQAELNSLKASRAHDLALLQEMATKVCKRVEELNSALCNISAAISSSLCGKVWLSVWPVSISMLVSLH
ncbi:hypothetical protein XELAEV_18004204mg [Xenopus laevis]|uniref:Uncharacterized protein n=1 Tax=Xenopus laevis TaxID=8355 RepID=A0A974BND7_XENLA|nr:hypothetical protein XELAEV_18004204mg [Xenopus laevis]